VGPPSKDKPPGSFHVKDRKGKPVLLSFSPTLLAAQFLYLSVYLVQRPAKYVF
jgi:hypothetical protein